MGDLRASTWWRRISGHHHAIGVLAVGGGGVGTGILACGLSLTKSLKTAVSIVSVCDGKMGEAY